MSQTLAKLRPASAEPRDSLSKGQSSSDSKTLTKQLLVASLLCTLSALLLLVVFEWKLYRNLLISDDVNIDGRLGGTWLKLSIAWFTWAKTIALTIPSLLIFLRFRNSKKNKLTRFLFYSCIALVFLWFTIDGIIYQSFGNHIAFYFEYVKDPNSWTMAGNPVAVASLLLKWILLVLSALWILNYLLTILVSTLLKHTSTKILQNSAYIITALTVSCASAGVIAPHFFPEPVERLYISISRTMPYSLGIQAIKQESPFLEAVELKLNSLYPEIAERTSQALPIDKTPLLSRKNPPNIIILLVETFRRDALNPEVMPELFKKRKDALLLNKHYAGGNLSPQAGISILSGRPTFRSKLNQIDSMHPQLLYTLREAGYQSTFFCASKSILGNNFQYIFNESWFDQLVMLGDDGGPEDWISTDVETLELIKKKVSESNQPQFTIAWLLSTHYPYVYPKEFEKFGPTITADETLHLGQKLPSRLKNRYLNSAHYVGSYLNDFLNSIDLSKNVVVITGDHGEGLFEDGTASHGSKFSEMQTAVPMLIFGAGIQPKTVTIPTTHSDLTPSLLHLIEGEPVNFNNKQGLDFADEELPEERAVLLGNENSDLLALYKDIRMRLYLRPATKKIETLHFEDEKGNIISGDPYPLTLVEQVVENINIELQRLAGLRPHFK